MLEKYDKLINKLVRGSITIDKFKKSIPYDLEGNHHLMIELFNKACFMENGDDIERLLFLGHYYNLDYNYLIDILCKLLKYTWHERHEDIVLILQQLKSPKTVDCLYETAITTYPMFKWDENNALARKCLFALGDINTPDSIKKIYSLSESKNEILRRHALEQINRLQMYKGDKNE
ncbi:MAG: hypothetical protein K0Q49_919 [Haloplasmataceae bacterium]|jgi:hypothetical protein|nr:hypothetical protein [Haloplasmataceae bacterium]